MQENRRLFDATDWSATPLGPVDGWAPEMRAVIATVLASGFPVSTAWGEDSIQIYNDAYNHIYGDKHPGSFGRPVHETWPEIWEFLGPALEQVRHAGQPMTFHDTLLPLARHGVPEECWFDFSYSAVPGADGQPLGVMSVATEKTRDVVLARRHATCDIPLDAMADGHLESLAQVLEDRLRDNPMDAAGAVLLVLDPGTGMPAGTLFQLGNWPGLAGWARTSIPRTAEVVQVEVHASTRPLDMGSRVTLAPLQDGNRQPIAWLALAPNALVPAAGHAQFVGALCGHLQRVLGHADTLGAYRRRIAEQDLLYRFLFDNIADAVLYARTDGSATDSETIVAANPGAAQLFGYTLDELPGMSRDQLRFPGDTQFEHALAERHHGGSFAGELTFRRKDGSAIQVDVSSRLVATRDGSMHSVNILRDASARAKEMAERARQARFETIAQLTAGMAHDFNNLLTVVQGSLELVLDDLPETARAREYAANALLCAERGAALTSQLLTYSRRQLLHLQTEDLNARIVELLPLVKATVGERIEVTTTLDPALPPCRTDLAQLTTALLNLAANARDAMPAGGTLRLDTYPDPDAPDMIVLRACDTGPGITAEVLDRIFEPYFTTKSRGAGLGLAMVQGFVHQSGGQVSASNAPDGGACFELHLPMATLAHGSARVTEARAIPARRHEHVLLVDDHPLIRGQTREILMRAGFQVSVAVHADETLARLHESLPDLLLTDVDMPGDLDGLALAREARDRYPALPLLVMTGHDPLAIEDAALAGDGIATLAKPFDRAGLLQAIAALLPAEAS